MSEGNDPVPSVAAAAFLITVAGLISLLSGCATGRQPAHHHGAFQCDYWHAHPDAQDYHIHRKCSH